MLLSCVPDIPIHSTEKLSYTTAKNYPPEEGAVRLPSLSNDSSFSSHPNISGKENIFQKKKKPLDVRSFYVITILLA